MSTLLKDINASACLCGSKQEYAHCCLPFHTYQTYPETAEQLMRSRYTAYALHLKEYLLETWDTSTRPGEIEFERGLVWKALTINGCKKGRVKDKQGWVRFTARYQAGLDCDTLHEKSYFIRDENGHWCYVDGEFKT